MTGFINLNKAAGKSSASAVAAVKRKFNAPCGHMGTLDPMAAGVLPVGIGKTSRLFPYLLDKRKTYIATFLFGETTDTLDVTGKVTATTDIIPCESDILSAVKFFIGEIEQVPPNYSAKCVDGKRGYQLARKGVDFSLPPKKVVIENIELLGAAGENAYRFKIDCRGGTYIRSLARDIGEKCGSLGVMSALERVKSGIFGIENSVTVEELSDSAEPQKYLIPADTAVDFEKLRLSEKQAKKILDGVYEDYGFKDGVYRVYNCGEFWGIGEAADGRLRIKAYVR